MIKWHRSSYIENNDENTLGFKLSVGYVVQVFDRDGNCTGQDFFTEGEVDYEDPDGKPFDNVPEKLYQAYHPYNMIQPSL